MSLWQADRSLAQLVLLLLVEIALATTKAAFT